MVSLVPDNIPMNEWPGPEALIVRKLKGSPSSSFCQASPQRICPDHSLDELFP